MSIEFTYVSASRWGCWRCGGSFEGDIPFTAEVKPQTRTADNEHFLCFAPVCQQCATTHGAKIQVAKLRAMLREVDTFVWRNPLLGALLRPYVNRRRAELREMLCAGGKGGGLTASELIARERELRESIATARQSLRRTIGKETRSQGRYAVLLRQNELIIFLLERMLAALADSMKPSIQHGPTPKDSA